MERALDRLQALNTTVFHRVLGDDFERLAPQVRALHTVERETIWRGEATITRGTHWLVPFFALTTQLPPSAANVPTQVTLAPDGDGETWRRDFGGARMASRYRAWNGRLVERLGLVEFYFSLGEHDGELLWATTGVRLLGFIPLPPTWFARVRCRERQNGERFEFLVEAALPWIGRIIRYEGWLEQA
jgi:hypothetical protein